MYSQVFGDIEARMKLVVCRRSLLVSVLAWAVLLAWSVPAAAQEAEASETESAGAGGHLDGFFLESADGDHRLGIGGRIQAQSRAQLSDEPTGRDLDELGLLIRRARLVLGGHTLTPDLSFKIQTDFAGSQFSLLEAWADYAFSPCLAVRAGKWRLPFLRQDLSSSGAFLLVDRSVTTAAFGDKFDTGVGLHNDFTAGQPFEWVVGVFNGATNRLGQVTYDDADAPSLFGPALVGRVNFNFGEVKPYRQTRATTGPLGFSVGAAVAADPGLERAGESTLKATVDYLLEVGGLSTSGGLMLATAQRGEGLGDQELLATGGFVQAGYLLTERLQPTARYSLVDVSEVDVRAHEVLGGFNVYFYGHRFKLQMDAGANINRDESITTTDLVARTQLQLNF
jgi:phosphate-selective porin OprO and OprP